MLKVLLEVILLCLIAYLLISVVKPEKF